MTNEFDIKHNELKMDVREAKTDVKALERDFQKHLIDASESKTILRQTQRDFDKLYKDVNGNGDPGLKQKIAKQAQEIATLKESVRNLRKLVWYMMLGGSAVGTGAGVGLSALLGV